jgi:colicin import membrane protein
MAQAGSFSAPEHDALLPQPPGGNGVGAALSVLVHLGLIAALTTAVDWRSQSTEVVSAELWSAVPETAAPRGERVPTPAPAPSPVPAPLPARAPVPAPAPPPPAPPPAPAPKPAPAPPTRPAELPQPEPDIAAERAARQKAQQEQQLAAKKKAQARAAQAASAAAEKALADAARQQKLQQARAAQAEEARLDKLRQQTLQRMMGEAGKVDGRSGNATRDAAPSQAYVAKLAAAIKRNSLYTGNLPDNPAAEVEVSAAPSGTIISRRLVKSSGHPDWDDAVLRAIDRTGQLPADERGLVPPRLIIDFKPNS